LEEKNRKRAAGDVYHSTLNNRRGS